MAKTRIVAAICGFILTGISVVSNADLPLPGWYAGGQIGWGDTHYSSDDFSANYPINNTGTIDVTGLAGRIFAGYQINNYFGVELGYTQFSNTHVKDINGISGLNGSVSEYAVDMSGKGTLPLGNYFGLNGKLGLAYVNANSHGGLDGTQYRFNPTFGVGVAWWATANVPIEASWTRIQKIGGNIPSTDLFTVGISYYFG